MIVDWTTVNCYIESLKRNIERKVTDKNYECSQLRAKLEAAEKEVEILRGRTVCSYPSFVGPPIRCDAPKDSPDFTPANPPDSNPSTTWVDNGPKDHNRTENWLEHHKPKEDELYTWDCSNCKFSMNNAYDYCWHCGGAKKYYGKWK